MLDSPSCKKSSKAEHCRRILYVLLRDLLASPIAGMILEKKSLRDRFYRDATSFPAYNYHLTGPAVGPGIKLLILIFLAGAVVVMLGYVIVYSIYFPSQLQRAWLYAMYTWLGFDCLFISTLEVLLLHVLLPLVIKADITVVLNLLSDVIAKYTDKVKHDHDVRTAAIEPVHVHRGKSIMLPDEVPEEVVIHNITDLFFVTTRIAEHNHDTSEARFLHSYNAMLPPGALFTEPAWYRQLDATLKANSKKYKTIPTITDADIGDEGAAPTPVPKQGGYRTVFSLDILHTAALKVLVMFIYCPVWVQDFVAHMTLVLVVGGLLLVMFALYRVDEPLVALPLILLALLICVLAFLDAIKRTLKWCFTPSHRVRPALPSHKYQINELNKLPNLRSVRNDRPSSSLDVETAIPLSVSSKPSLLQPFPIAANANPLVMGTPTTKPLAVDGKPPFDPSSPDRYPKQMPVHGSPYPRQDVEFFPGGSESETDNPAAAQARVRPEKFEAPVEAEPEAASPKSARSAKSPAKSPPRAPRNVKLERQSSNRRAAPGPMNFSEGTSSKYQYDETGADQEAKTPDGAHTGKSFSYYPHTTGPDGLRDEVQNLEDSGAEGGDNGVDDVPAEPMPDAVDNSRSFSLSDNASDRGGENDAFSQEADNEASDASISDSERDANAPVRRAQSGKLSSPSKPSPVGKNTGVSPVNAKVDDNPPLRMQNLVLSAKSSGSLPTVPAATMASASPPKPATVLPVSLIAQSVESEQEDSDYESYGSNGSEESFDDPIDHSM